MSTLNSRPTKSSAQPRSRRRRPTGVSRRQKKQNLGFETLEDRRVMSADPLGSPEPLVGPAPLTSYSNATPEGQFALLQAELDRYARAAANNGPADLRTRALPSDELFNLQWYLLNVGQEIPNPTLQTIVGTPGEDINYLGARELGYTGAGVNVAVIDSGVQLDHPDINIHPTLQFDAIDGDGDASPELPVFDPDFPFFFFDGSNAHGTSVAGIIAGLENGEGTVGIAPDAQIVPIRLIDIGQTPLGAVESFQYGVQNADIINNSWGPVDGIRQLAGPTGGELFALQSSVFGPNAGRNGLGTIHVWAAGNGAAGLDSASYDGYVNSRYTIGVTGVDHDGQYANIDGTVSSIAESGPSVLVAAPYGSFSSNDIGDDIFIGSGIATADTTDFTGFNVPPASNGLEIDGDFLEVDRDAYTTQFGGTSAAAPQVAGVIALMLEANPNLGWRDVQDILVRSARQNAPTETLADGFDKATGREFQSTWILNQIPLFHEPDVYDPQIDNGVQFFSPTLDPTLTLTGNLGLHKHYAPTPQVLTNGAGFTISQGRGTNFDQIGYAHGVVDAGLAVRLAEQWTTKGQILPAELSFTTTLDSNDIIPVGGTNTTIAAAHVVDPGGVDLIIPGGLGATGNWQGYYDEYFAPNPDFSQFAANTTRGGVMELTVPQINGQDIVVEHIEVLLDIGGSTSEALDHLRITLVSPNGTHSELNHYFIDEGFVPANQHQTLGGPFNPLTGNTAQSPNGQNGVSFSGIDRISPTPINDNNLVFNFSTNRNWGERSDDAIIFNPLTNEPYVTPPGLGGNLYNQFEQGSGISSTVGDLISQGWQLHFENYGDTAFNLNSVEIVWHGSPVGANTERVSGKIGIDSDQSDTFNYNRFNQNPVQSPTDFTAVDIIPATPQIEIDPNVIRLGEVQNIVDAAPEPFAADVTVFAYRDVNNNGIVDSTDILEDQFVTGHDGNYYFDLVPGNYLITTDDTRAFDDELTPDGFLPGFQTTWRLTENFFKVWDYDANLDVPVTVVDGVETPSAFLDGNNAEVVTGIRNLNFLLDPGAPAAPEVNFSGVIFADFNGDGIFNGDDISMPNIGVFGDTNRNGSLDPGEVLVNTDATGQYNFTVDRDTAAVIDVGVIAPVDWTVIAPGPGTATFTQNGVTSTLAFDADNMTYTFFTQPGDTLAGVDFAIQPPAVSTGGGGTNPTGTLIGSVFDDANQSQIRDANELGVSGVTVYIDSNNSNSFEAGELFAVTNQNGSFVFTEVAAGEHVLRLANIASPLIQTVPFNGFPNTVNLSASGTISNIVFGIANSAVLDFGDLPAAYGITRLSEDGARSRKGAYFLGARVDAELDGQPSPGAVGDDTFGDDEDGVIVQPLTAGNQDPNAQGQLTATASRFGGFLQAWIDFNGDFDFDDPGENVISNYGLLLGPNTIEFDLPDFIADGQLFARFRYGSFNMGLTGLDTIGEIEDYQLVLNPPDPGPAVISGDFDEDGDTDGADFLAWQRGAGMTSNANRGNGDANNDQAVNTADLTIWQQDYGQTSLALAASQAAGDSGNTVDSQLAAFSALAVQGNVLEAELAPALRSTSSASTVQAPNIIQPGFPEELPASVELQSLVTVGLNSVVGSNEAPAVSAEQATEQPAALTDEGFAALEQAEATGNRIESLTNSGSNEAEEEAIAVALEEIDWLLS